MIVVTLEKCPLSLRGDLTKWLQEICPGVYVGRVSARVRDGLWQRICKEAKSGRATMVYSTSNEQHYDFRVHNTLWEPVEFDGIKLMLRPSPARISALGKKRLEFSYQVRRRSAGRGIGRESNGELDEYVVFDIETTGLDVRRDEIIEIAAIKVSDGEVVDEYCVLVRPTKQLSHAVTELTGLHDDDFDQACSPMEAVAGFLDFVQYMPLVAHNSEYDLSFLEAVIAKYGLDELDNDVVDTLVLARKKLPDRKSYRLDALAQSFDIDTTRFHRALDDAKTTMHLYLLLNKTK